MKSIDELLHDKPDSEPDTKIESQIIEDYSDNQIAQLLKQSVNIHWQQAMELTGQGIHLKRWGYKKLGELFYNYGKEEHEHAAIAISRLEFFDEDYQPITISPKVWKRHDIKSIIEFNLQGVKNAAIIEKAIITAARIVGDEMTAKIMIPLLKGSDDGIKEFEQMLKLIEQLGLENFLTLQV